MSILESGMELTMFYEQSQKVGELKHRLQSFMDRHVYPNEEGFYKEAEELGPWKVYPVVEELKPKAKAAGLWNLFLPRERARRRPHQPRIRAAVRGDGAITSRARTVQLLGARYRQHGSAGALRHQGASGEVAEAAAGRRNPLLLCDDRAGRGLQRRHQHRKFDRQAMATTMSSTAANGTPPMPPTRAAGSASSWARPILTIPTAIASSR